MEEAGNCSESAAPFRGEWFAPPALHMLHFLNLHLMILKFDMHGQFLGEDHWGILLLLNNQDRELHWKYGGGSPITIVHLPRTLQKMLLFLLGKDLSLFPCSPDNSSWKRTKAWLLWPHPQATLQSSALKTPPPLGTSKGTRRKQQPWKVHLSGLAF